MTTQPTTTKAYTASHLKKPRKPYTPSAKTLAKRAATSAELSAKHKAQDEEYRRADAYDGLMKEIADWREMYDELKVKYTKKYDSVNTLDTYLDKAEEENIALKRALMEMTAAYLKAKKN
jgi:3-methyladenine DNA glycosylase AlkD